ncbi:protein phosphatase 2C domain-containing protein [Streptomyces capparidis]
MRIELATEPGGPDRPNEDFASAALPAAGRGGALVLLDGVTPPPDDDGCVHGVPWFASRLGGALLEMATSHPGASLRACLADAIERTARAHAGGCDLSHARTPQATVVAVRWSPESVEYLVLSDSVLLLDLGTRVEAVLDDRLDRLPDPVTARRAAVRALAADAPERAAAVAEYVAAVEALRNAEGGFFTAAADPSVAARAVAGAVPREEVRAVAALSDGASRLVEMFGETDWAGAMALLRKQGPRELIARVRAAECAGAARGRHKRHDDATAVLAEL